MSRLLIVATDPSQIGSAEAFALALGLPWDVLLLTGSLSASCSAERAICPSLNEMPLAEAFSANVQALSGGYTHFAAPATMRAKDLMYRLAGLLDAAAVTDVIGIEAPNRLRRPMVAGAVIATVETTSEPVVLTFRSSAFKAIEGAGRPEVVPLEWNSQGPTCRLASNQRTGSRPDLGTAKVVVSGGRPLKDAETYERLIGGLADTLGGAAGATRAAVDSGIAANELQVGQTGKIVAPDLYIAAGISGSTQHLAGMKDSRCIVAINTDPEAPIFESADLGLVQDLHAVLPKLIEELRT